MNGFVEQCRLEWRRLGVPDAVANEMAADLAADLAEAAAEGLTPEDVLGTGAFDPKAFAASWAAERGVMRGPEPPPRWRGWLIVATATFAAVALVGLLFTVGSPSGSVHVAVGPASARVAVLPLPRISRLPGSRVAVLPRFRVVTPRVAAVDLGHARRHVWWVGLTMLLVGVVGAGASTAVWLRTR